MEQATDAAYREALEEIQELLWPRDNPDASWSPDTIEEIARIVAAVPGFGPPKLEQEDV